MGAFQSNTTRNVASLLAGRLYLLRLPQFPAAIGRFAFPFPAQLNQLLPTPPHLLLLLRQPRPPPLRGRESSARLAARPAGRTESRCSSAAGARPPTVSVLLGGRAAGAMGCLTFVATAAAV